MTFINGFSALDLQVMVPYGVLGIGTCVLLLMACVVKQEKAWIWQWASILMLMTVAASVFLPRGFSGAAVKNLLYVDVHGQALVMMAILLSILSLPILPMSENTHDRRSPSGVLSLVFLSLTGAILMIMANHVLVFFVGLELFSLPIYVLVAIGGNRRRSMEAAFKYFFTGAIASAFLVFGAAMMYASGHHLFLEGVPMTDMATGSPDTLRVVGAIFIVVALLFKLGVFPFHSWTLDVYSAASPRLLSWMAGMSKLAIVGFSMRFFSVALFDYVDLWFPALAALAAMSMVFGGFGGLRQKDLKRLLGYSSVSHAGFFLFGLALMLPLSTAEVRNVLVYYAMFYVFSAYVAFLMLGKMSDQDMVDYFDLDGFRQRFPVQASVFGVGILSLAGFPPLAGFFAKLRLFGLGLEAGATWVVILAVVASLASLAYYLFMLISAFLKPVSNLGDGSPRSFAVKEASLSQGLLATFMIAMIFIFGLFPDRFFGLFFLLTP